MDGLHKTSSRPVGGASDSSAVEPVVAKPSSTNSKKGGEVGVVIFDFCFLFLLFLLERILTNCGTNYHQKQICILSLFINYHQIIEPLLTAILGTLCKCC